jgi:hypothetical protein
VPGQDDRRFLGLDHLRAVARRLADAVALIDEQPDREPIVERRVRHLTHDLAFSA